MNLQNLNTMEQHIFISMSQADLLNLVKEGVIQAQKETLQKENTNLSYSINQVAKELGRSHTTIKKLIIEGKLKTTSGGRRISVEALENYLREPG